MSIAIAMARPPPETPLHDTPARPLPPPRRIAVLRALMLGDMLCALPALRALRQGWPAAHITLVGLPWAAELAQRWECINGFVALPGHPGLPEQPCDVRLLPAFLQQVQALELDLALQLHGSGNIVNTLVASFGARATAGFFDARAWVPPQDRARYVQWPCHGHEIERLLALTDHLGLARQGLALDFPLRHADHAQARALCAPLRSGHAYAIVHAGAQLASRRWPVERFKAVAQALADRGLAIVLTGSASEAGLATAIAQELGGRAINLCGKTSLWSLGALVDAARCVVSNDTGISHIAAARGCRSVVVSCGADVARWAPLDAALHRVLAHDVPCRPCGYAACPYDHACALGVEVETVLEHLPAELR